MTAGGPEEPRRCGFVALLGAPNAGKSTLANSLTGARVSIVTPKAQTTRSPIRAITIAGASQIVLVDTPGIFEPKRRLDRSMVAAAWTGAEQADILVLVCDAARRACHEDARPVVDGLRELARPALLVLNKIDLLDRERLLALAADFDAERVFERIFMISALTGDGISDLRGHLAAALPVGPWLFPEDQISDLPLRLHAAEITREKLFLNLHQELPYALTVETEDWRELGDGSIRIEQVIFLQRDGHKGIVLGKGGSRIKRIRETAQKEIEALTGAKVHLFLFVKVRRGWLDDPERYRPWGLPFEV